jgi:hypothetical protein
LKGLWKVASMADSKVAATVSEWVVSMVVLRADEKAA